MNRCVKTVLLLLFFPAFLQAQAFDEKQRWGISFTPSIVSTPSLEYAIQPGIEYRVNERFFLLTEIAFSPFLKNKDSSSLDRKYLRIKPELRYLLSKRRSNFEKYVALQLSWSFRRFTDLAGGIYYNDAKVDTVVMAYDQAKINSPIFTGSAQFGSYFRLGKNLFLDFFAGIGVRYIHTKHSEAMNLRTDRYYHPIDKIILTPDEAHIFEGGLYRFHFNTGLRLLYRFR